MSIQHEAADTAGKTGGKPKLIVRLSRPHNTPAPTHAPSAAHSHWPRKYQYMYTRSLNNPSSNYKNELL
jgi:hypothetical protein